MSLDFLIALAVSLAQSPHLCEQKTYDELYRTAVLIDIKLAEKSRAIESTCIPKFKSQCIFSEENTKKLELYRTFRYDVVMAMRARCNGQLSTFEKP